MYVLFGSMLLKIRSHGFVVAYMLGRLISQNAFPLIALNNSHIFSNLSEELRALLSSRWKYRFYFRHSVFVIIADTTKLWQSSCLFYYICCLDCPAYPLTKRIMRKAFSFSTVMVKLVDLMHVLFISVFV